MNGKLALLAIGGVFSLLGPRSACLAEQANPKGQQERAGIPDKAGADPADAEFQEALRKADQLAAEAPDKGEAFLLSMEARYKPQGAYAHLEVIWRRILKLREAKFGQDHADVAFALSDLAIWLSEQGRYSEAEPLHKRALAIYEKTLGPDKPHVAASLANLAGVYRDQGRYSEAEPLHKRALAIREKTLGPDHPEVATSLNNLAALYHSKGQDAAAEPLQKRALAILEKALGPDHPDTATSLNNLALLYDSQGQYAAAEPLYKRALAISEKALGPDHPDVALSLNNLATLYYSQGQYAAAEPLLKRALAIREKALGPDHPEVAQSLNNLAVLYGSQGQYAAAEPLHQRALAIRERALGPDHPGMANSLNSLAKLYHSQGQYAAAEPLTQRALAICEKALGPDHPNTATSLNNLAGLYDSQGQYAAAEPLYQRALAIREKALGPHHPDTAISLNNLAGLYRAQGQYAAAEPLYKRSLAIREKALGPDHPDVARSLGNLAGVYEDQGQYAAAEPLRKRALAICEKALGHQHPDVATSLDNLAELYRAQGQYAAAEPLLKRALAVREKALGPEHPDVANSLHNLAGLYLGQGQHAAAEPLLKRALAISEMALGPDNPDVAGTLIGLTIVAMHGRDLSQVWEHAWRARGILLKARPATARSAVTRSSWQAKELELGLVPGLALILKKEQDPLELLEQERSLGLRELLAEAKAQAASVIEEKDRLRVSAALARLNALNAQIEQHAAKGHPVGALQNDLRRAEMDYDSLMAELRERYEQFVATQTAKGITSKQAAGSPSLDGETAIVGWLALGDWTWGYVVRRDGVFWKDLSDLAKPVGAALGGRPISQGSHKGLPLPGRIEKAIPELAAGGPPAELGSTLAEIYRCRFAPLLPHLDGIKRLIVIAQDWAAVLPVEALLSGEPGKATQDCASWPWLCDRYEISYAPSVTTLDILCRQREARKARQWEKALFAVGDPPFSDEQLAQMKSEKHPLTAGTGGATDASLLTLGRAIRFDPTAVPPRLPGTRREVEVLAGLLGPEKSLLLLGPDASERKLFEASERGDLKKCRYVHLATHGLADGERPELSALLLARAPQDPDYDGLLQMREVFHLKLDADLVVLSACRTGLGKQLRGEGVVGLSTAFFFAGTPSLVMSLWNVPDVSTALLMRRFYANLTAGQTKAAALREAKAWLRNLTVGALAKLGQEDPLYGRGMPRPYSGLTRAFGEAVRVPSGPLVEDKPFAHPHFWAGFVLTGDPK